MNNSNLTTEELNAALSNKQKAADDLSRWLSRHSNSEPEYRRVWADRNALADDLIALKYELDKRSKPFYKSLNETFEL